MTKLLRISNRVMDIPTMRMSLYFTPRSLLAVVLFLLSFVPSAGNPAVAASNVAELLGDQPAGTLAAKLQPTEVPAVEGITIERSARKVEVPGTGAAVIIKSNAQLTPGSKLDGELTAAQLVFQVAGKEDAGYSRLEHSERKWYESTFFQGGERWLRVGKDWHHPGERGTQRTPLSGSRRRQGDRYGTGLQGALCW